MTGTVGDFVLRGALGTASHNGPTLVSAVTKEEINNQQINEDTEALAAALSEEFKWTPNERVKNDRVVAILSENTV